MKEYLNLREKECGDLDTLIEFKLAFNEVILEMQELEGSDGGECWNSDMFLRVSQLITSITLFMVVIELVRTKRQLVDVLELLNVSFDTLNKKIDYENQGNHTK